MAPRIPRRRRRSDEPPADDAAADEHVHLDGDEHAWWAQRDVADVWRPREPPPSEPEEERDVLADHFGADWRSSFGFEPAPEDRPPDAEQRPATPEPPPDTTDPYAVLQVDEQASWDEIVDAHRRLARQHHPDRLHGASDGHRTVAEAWIRAVNQAYAELKVRRGR